MTPQEVKEALSELRDAGVSTPSIADEVGVSPAILREFARGNDYALGPEAQRRLERTLLARKRQVLPGVGAPAPSASTEDEIEVGVTFGAGPRQEMRRRRSFRQRLIESLLVLTEHPGEWAIVVTYPMERAVVRGSNKGKLEDSLPYLNQLASQVRNGEFTGEPGEFDAVAEPNRGTYVLWARYVG